MDLKSQFWVPVSTSCLPKSASTSVLGQPGFVKPVMAKLQPPKRYAIFSTPLPMVPLPKLKASSRFIHTTDTHKYAITTSRIQTNIYPVPPSVPPITLSQFSESSKIDKPSTSTTVTRKYAGLPLVSPTLSSPFSDEDVQYNTQSSSTARWISTGPPLPSPSESSPLSDAEIQVDDSCTDLPPIPPPESPLSSDEEFEINRLSSIMANGSGNYTLNPTRITRYKRIARRCKRNPRKKTGRLYLHHRVIEDCLEENKKFQQIVDKFDAAMFKSFTSGHHPKKADSELSDMDAADEESDQSRSVCSGPVGRKRPRGRDEEAVRQNTSPVEQPIPSPPGNFDPFASPMVESFLCPHSMPPRRPLVEAQKVENVESSAPCVKRLKPLEVVATQPFNPQRRRAQDFW